MKHNWDLKSFTDVATTITPISKIEKSEYMASGLYPIISQEDVLVSGYWNDHEDLTPHSAPVVIFGDHTRVLKYVDFEFAVGADGIKIIQPKGNLNAKFLYHYLKWLNVPSLGYSRHFKLIKESKYSVPPMNVQEQIVVELDRINEIVSDCKKAICNLNDLAQSLFYDYFGNPITNPQGWPTMNFGDLALSINYGTSLPATECGKYPYIRMNNLTDNGYLDLSSLKYIDIPDSELDKYLAQKGDILFNRTNSREKVGKTALFDRAEEMVIAGYIIRVRVKEESLNPVFAVRYMNLPELKKLLRKICRGAVNQANINSKEMASIPFIVPPLSLQEKFASRIEQIEQQKKDLEDTIANMQTLLDSRMDYWFG